MTDVDSTTPEPAPHHPEIGPEIPIADLDKYEGKVVVVRKYGYRTALTMWLVVATDSLAVFHAKEINMILIALRKRDNTLRDDTGKQILVFQYLGEL